jgi:cytochrome b6-f complex iron-sulfur subunit
MSLSRQDFLKLSTRALLGFSALLGLGGLLRYLSYEPDPPPPSRFDVGKADDYPPGTHTVLPAIPAVLIHDKNGFTALSMICTHLGCTVEVRSGEFVCPCHGSRYDAAGNVLRGPAASPLPALKVEVTKDGKLVVTRE